MINKSTNQTAKTVLTVVFAVLILMTVLISAVPVAMLFASNETYVDHNTDDVLSAPGWGDFFGWIMIMGTVLPLVIAECELYFDIRYLICGRRNVYTTAIRIAGIISALALAVYALGITAIPIVRLHGVGTPYPVVGLILFHAVLVIISRFAGKSSDAGTPEYRAEQE